MSVDALVQVFRDHRDVSPGVQAVLIALAWKTPRGRDSTVPVSYADLAVLTRQHPNTVRNNVLRAISTGAAELVWAKAGQPSRYRVNRGEWFVPGSPADLEAAYDRVNYVQGVLNDGGGTDTMVVGDPHNHADPLRNKEVIEEKGDGLSVFAAKNAPLLERLREKGNIE